MVVADKKDAVCGAANQGPEVGPSSPSGRADHPVLDFHPSQRSAASESTPNCSNISPATILKVLRFSPQLAN